MPVIAHIEDDPADHDLLAQSISDEHELYFFPDLASFLDSKMHFDLIITDLSLPKTFGYETLEQVHRARPSTPILALTGMAGSYMTGDIMKKLLEKGADNVVSKDILLDHARITTIIEDLLT